MEEQIIPKKKKIKNELYRQFLDTGLITTLDVDTLGRALDNIKGRYAKQGRALLIHLYYTGARPVESLTTKAKQFKKEGTYLAIQQHTMKKGIPRMIYLSFRKPYVKELYDYAISIYPEMYVFFNYQGHYTRTKVNKKGVVKQYVEVTDKLRYHFKKWFEGVIDITPYFLRHNRISKLSMAGASPEEMRLFKGAKDYRSVMPYAHMSTKSAKKMDKMNE